MADNNQLSYHLLRVLSQPPTLVPQRFLPGWKTGDVLRIANPSLLSSSHHFIVLDADGNGSILALNISDRPDHVWGGNTVIDLDVTFALNKPTMTGLKKIHMNKFYSTSQIIGGGLRDQIEDVSVVGHFSDAEMSLIKEALAKLLFAGPWSTLLEAKDIRPRFDEFIATAHKVLRFLNRAYFKLGIQDYARIRETLGLKPMSSFGEDIEMMCDCEDHKLEKPEADVLYNPDIYKTWNTLLECAQEAGVKENLVQLGETIRNLGFQAGERIPHHLIPKTCWIGELPTELLLHIIESFEQDFDRDSVLNLSRTCKLFNNVVNQRLYSSIALSVKEEKWDAVVKVLPKYGHFTKEIYLEAPSWDSGLMKRVVFSNLRAIGDFCPNLERLDLNYPARLSLTATPEDLPPKLGEENVQAAAPSSATALQNNGPQAIQVDPPVNADAAADENDENDEDGSDNDEDDDDDENIPPGQQAAEERLKQEKRMCAELDYIIANCSHLKNFSMQWTGPQALTRFYQKIKNLQAIRLWDRNITDSHLLALGKECRNLERFYIDAQDCFLVNAEGLIGFLKALHGKDKSRLKRFGIQAPQNLGMRLVPNLMGMDVDEDDDDDDGASDMSQDEDEGNENAQADGNDATPSTPAPPQVSVDLAGSPMYQFLDALSSKHPALERLALIQCQIVDGIVIAFSAFENLQSLDIQKPVTGGLTSTGIDSLVRCFKDKRLRSLDLSRHDKLTEDDMDTLTGPEGIKSIRYVRVAGCRHLKDKYLVDEWVHPDDFVCEDGTWRPRAGEGKSLLEIGDGWKEPWSDYAISW